MSERVLEGPLDVTRRLALDAHDVANLRELCYPLGSPELQEARELLNAIEEEHPLLGDMVEIFGTELVVSVDGDEEYPITIPDDRDEAEGPGRYNRWCMPTKGQYQGLYIIDAYLPQADETTTVVTHGVLTEVVNKFDRYGNYTPIHYMSHVLAEEDVIIKPVLPVNTHSLQDLLDDPAMVEFDRLVHEPVPNRAEQVRRIGRFANRVFEIMDYDDPCNLQRVSYLNSTGLLEDVDVFGTDFIYGTREGYIDDQINVIYNDPGKGSAQIQNAVFDVLPGYSRISGGGVRLMEPPELFVTAHSVSGWVAIPAVSVLKATENVG